MKGRDIIVVGLQPWDIEIGSNCKNIALEFSKENRVLYVNPPLDVNTRIRKRKVAAVRKRIEIRRTGKTLVQISETLWNVYPECLLYSINWIPSTPLFKAFCRINSRKLSGDIRKAADRLGFKNPILFNDSDMFRSFFLKENLKPALSIYYSRDNLVVSPYWGRHGRILEPELMRKSDLVVANSAYLAKVAARYNPLSFDVGQGCDLTLFDPAVVRELPPELAKIKKPIIGYIGAIVSSRLDLSLLLQLCKSRSEWCFVFVGKPEGDFLNSELQKLPNVYFLGPRDPGQLPSYLAGFDVAMNPQALNDFTIGNYPRKIDEYLSMGKPVVATKTETMELFRDYVFLAPKPEDYPKCIEDALLANSPDLQKIRHEFAASHTWAHSVQLIYDAIRAAAANRH